MLFKKGIQKRFPKMLFKKTFQKQIMRKKYLLFNHLPTFEMLTILYTV